MFVVRREFEFERRLEDLESLWGTLKRTYFWRCGWFLFRVSGIRTVKITSRSSFHIASFSRGKRSRDLVLVDKRKDKMNGIRIKGGSDVGSDHYQLGDKFKTKTKTDQSKVTPKRKQHANSDVKYKPRTSKKHFPKWYTKEIVTNVENYSKLTQNLKELITITGSNSNQSHH